jgi:hypothetical protein
MAFTALTVTTSAKTGTVQPSATAVDGTNGNRFTNTGREVVEINNGGGAPITVTIQTALTYQGYAIANQDVSVTNGTAKWIGPFDTALFNDTSEDSSGAVHMTFSSGTSVTARVTRLGST